jgi:hypothetical protein
MHGTKRPLEVSLDHRAQLRVAVRAKGHLLAIKIRVRLHAWEK